MSVSGGAVASKPTCRIGDDCSSCKLVEAGDSCTEETTQESLYCDLSTKLDQDDLPYKNALFSVKLISMRMRSFNVTSSKKRSSGSSVEK